MEQLLSAIPINFTDQVINDSIEREQSLPEPYTRHFTQSEEFFLQLKHPYEVGTISIHHDVRAHTPDSDYLEVIRALVRTLYAQIPDVLGGLTYFFDSADVLRPAFFRLYRLEDMTYLYLLRLDLHFRPNVHAVLERGSNDATPRYSTDQVIVESDVVPLTAVQVVNGKIRGFDVERSVSQTWIGETGRGYHLQGVWIDRELTRFFSKLFVPRGVRAYPYFPFSCKYRSVCHSVITFSDDARRKSLPFLHNAREFLRPHMREIERALREEQFTERMPEFISLKQSVGDQWDSVWRDYSVRTYLNKDDQKEFQLEHGII